MGACDLNLKNKNKMYQNKIKFIIRFNENPQTANPAVVLSVIAVQLTS